MRAFWLPGLVAGSKRIFYLESVAAKIDQQTMLDFRGF
jgi:hypothetical protein